MKTPLRKALQVLNILGFLGTIAVNALANILPIAGNNTGELSDSYPNLFVPAGLTFSIWGLIYLLLGIFAVYQAVGLFKKDQTISGDSQYPSFLDRISWFFLLSCAANIGWIFAWHHKMVGLSLILMLVILASLLIMYLRLGVRYGRTAGRNAETEAASGDARQKTLKMREKVFIHLPMSIYLGWITVATIANITALLVNLGWNGFGLSESFWTVLVMGAGLVIGLLVVFSRRDPAYSAVIVWAYAGILLKRLT
ncbi:MAG: hypothetical protein E4H36_07330, partial [Spirochaetales bacterium]